MIKNVNLNNMRGLLLEGVDYLSHKDINIVNGNTTIEVCFSTAQKPTADCILYGQSGNSPRFALGIKENRIYFTYGSATLISKLEIPKELNYISVVVTVNQKNMIIYLNGCLIDQANCEYDECFSQTYANNDIVIGKGLNGGLLALEVYSKCYEEDEILKHQLMHKKVTEDTELFLKFQRNGEYFDLSKNHLILISHNGPAVSSFVFATKFWGAGCFERKSLVSTAGEYTLCMQVYLLPSKQKTSCIFCLHNQNKELLEIAYEKDNDSNYRLSCKNEGFSLTSLRVLPSRMWYTIVLVWNKDGLKLYIDGDLDNSNVRFVCPEKMQTACVIGGDFNKHNFLFGYINYVSEYNKSFSAEQVIGLFEVEPFIFDNNIISLHNFSTAIKDLVKNENLIAVDSCEQNLYPGTNPVNAPSGIKRIPPSKTSLEYYKLSPKEQVKFHTVFNLIYKGLSDVTGYKLKGNVSTPYLYEVLRSHAPQLCDYIKAESIKMPIDQKFLMDIITKIFEPDPMIVATLFDTDKADSGDDDVFKVFVVIAFCLIGATIAARAIRAWRNATNPTLDTLNLHNTELQEIVVTDVFFKSARWHMANNNYKFGSVFYCDGPGEPSPLSVPFEHAHNGSFNCKMKGVFTYGLVYLVLNVTMRNDTDAEKTIIAHVMDIQTDKKLCVEEVITLQPMEEIEHAFTITFDIDREKAFTKRIGRYAIVCNETVRATIDTVEYIIKNHPQLPWKYDLKAFDPKFKFYVNLKLLDNLLPNETYSFTDFSDIMRCIGSSNKYHLGNTVGILSDGDKVFDLMKLLNLPENSKLSPLEMTATHLIALGGLGAKTFYSLFGSGMEEFETRNRIDIGSSTITHSALEQVSFIALVESLDDRIKITTTIACLNHKINMSEYPITTSNPADFKIFIGKLAEKEATVNVIEPYKLAFFKERIFPNGYNITFGSIPVTIEKFKEAEN